MPRNSRDLSTAQTARRLKISESQVYKYAASGQLPARRLRGRLVFDAADVERLARPAPAGRPAPSDQTLAAGG
jgi:excisionase family DNA binding protein